MNTQPINNTGFQPSERSMNSYLQHQSRKSTTFFEGSACFGDIAGGDQQREWSRMEERLQSTRERIEKAVLAMKMISANAAQLDDDGSHMDAQTISLISNL